MKRYLFLILPLLGISCTIGIETTSTNNMKADERIELALQASQVTVELTGTEKAVVLTNRGEFTFELYSTDAPNTVSNFIRLAEAGFYDGLTWHRYVAGFVIQGGDPLGDGTGNAGYNIDFEGSGQPHVKGAVGMARSQDPNSASCQFYVCLEAAHHLNGGYCVFGKVIDGMDVVKQLRVDDKIESITIVR